jgi:hypothetical protein
MAATFNGINVKDVYCFYKINNNLNSCVDYKMNNWFEKLYQTNIDLMNSESSYDQCAKYNKSINVRPSAYTLCQINNKGGAIWLSIKGEICYRLSPYDEVIISSISNAEFILSSYLNLDIEIGKNSNHTKASKNLYANDLLIVDGEKFNPYKHEEFFDYKTNEIPSVGFYSVQHNRNVTYINKFKPSIFLKFVPESEDINKIKPSIILQYIYYLSSYKLERLEYILNWIANFFKDLKNRSDISLVLVGEKSSGKELFFDEIITPLFGRKYCTKITNYNLNTNNHTYLIKEKLFYCLANLSNSINNHKNKHFLQNLTSENSIFFDRNNGIEEIQLYGQLLITSNEHEILYLDFECDNFTIFNVPKDINEMYINNEMKNDNKTLKELIKEDLENFALILKFHKVNTTVSHKRYIDDDKKSFQDTLKIKLSNFHNSLCNQNGRENLLKNVDQSFADELTKDFEQNQIKQKNLHPLFVKLYPNEDISNRMLIKLLRTELDQECYENKSIKNGKSGKKYINLS